jgi:hypothetical protein
MQAAPSAHPGPPFGMAVPAPARRLHRRVPAAQPPPPHHTHTPSPPQARWRSSAPSPPPAPARAAPSGPAWSTTCCTPTRWARWLAAAPALPPATCAAVVGAAGPILRPCRASPLLVACSQGPPGVQSPGSARRRSPALLPGCVGRWQPSSGPWSASVQPCGSQGLTSIRLAAGAGGAGGREGRPGPAVRRARDSPGGAAEGRAPEQPQAGAGWAACCWPPAAGWGAGCQQGARLGGCTCFASSVQDLRLPPVQGV